MMTTVLELLLRLREQDIQVWVEGENLRVNAPQGHLTPDILAEIKQRKAELLAYFSQSSGMPHLRRMPRPARIPASYTQQRLWFIQQLDPQSVAYNISKAFRLHGLVDLLALDRALKEILQRHEILRTTLVEEAGQPWQSIHPGIPGRSEQDASLPAYEWIDLRDMPESGRSGEAVEVLRRAARQPFDLAQGPLVRFWVVCLGEQEHIFQVSLHHVVMDGWSLGIFFQELSRLYQAFCQGQPSPLPELPIQFADYALCQREWLEAGALEKLLSYWCENLAGPVETLQLPTDYPRPERLSYNGARQEFALSPQTSQRLRALGQAENATLFMLLAAAFNILIYRYTAQEDILVGYPIANRNQLEVEEMIGYLANTLVLRSDLSGDPSFRQFLSRVRGAVLDAFAHQDMPFEKLVQELNPQRNLSRTPLFQVMFTWQNMTATRAPRSTQPFTLFDLEVSPLNIDDLTSPFEWTLMMYLGSDQALASSQSNKVDPEAHASPVIQGCWEFDTDLFAPETIQRVIGHFCTLLDAVVANPDQPLSQLPLLTSAESQQILHGWNNTYTDYPRQLSVPQLFEIQVQKTPQSIAVVYGEESLTYRQLNNQANQLGWHLRQLGVEPGMLVGLCLERSPGMVAAMIAILKAGGAYVPLDPSYPPERLGFMLQDSGAQVLLTTRRWLGALPTGETQRQLKIVLLDQESFSQLSSENLPDQATPESLAYVMYTSGSTGTPKGICIPHRAINRLVLNTNYISLGSGDHIAQASNAAFDAATFEIWGALLNGACLVGLDQDTLLSAHEFAAALRQKKIDVLFLTTALFNQIASVQPGAFATLRELLFGGEAVTPFWVRQVLQTAPPRRLLHVYGPTENTTFSTWHLIQDVPQVAPHYAPTIPIGKPVANSTAYILDGSLNPQPVGVAGEVYLGGEGLAQGYLSRPDLTAEKFIPNPFSQAGEIQDRLYRTGDWARYLPNGSIEFLGRLDDQVKLRGFRVELGEIEAALVGHPSIKQAAVLILDDSRPGSLPGDKRLVAYVVRHATADAASDDLRTYLRSKLPAFMIPAAFIFLEALPLNPNGKVDRKRLPLPEPERPSKKDEKEMPRDALERQLVYIWENALGVRPVGIQDNFFDLGGHSLLAARVFTQIEQLLGTRLPLATLFQAPTVAELADILRHAPDSKGWATLVPIQPQGSLPPFFCVHNFGGEVVNYAELSNRLGKDQPFYGLQAQGIDGVNPPHTTLPEMAAHYIEAMRTVQPNGPYYLGGYCFGGVVAYEMACQLHQQGEKVGLVALMDSSPPRRNLPPHLSQRQHRIGNFLRNLPAWLVEFLRSGEILIVLRRKLRISRKRLEARLGRGVEITPFDIIGDAVRTDSLPHKQLMDIHMRALWGYQVPDYPGRVTLFRIGRMPLFRAIEYDFGWSLFATGGVDVQIVPGAHYNILEEPHVPALAQKLAQSLAQAYTSTVV
jgi:amino acid adenylation domain-containing protein